MHQQRQGQHLAEQPGQQQQAPSDHHQTGQGRADPPHQPAEALDQSDRPQRQQALHQQQCQGLPQQKAAATRWTLRLLGRQQGIGQLEQSQQWQQRQQQAEQHGEIAQLSQPQASQVFADHRQAGATEQHQGRQADAAPWCSSKGDPGPGQGPQQR